MVGKPLRDRTHAHTHTHTLELLCALVSLGATAMLFCFLQEASRLSCSKGCMLRSPQTTCGSHLCSQIALEILAILGSINALAVSYTVLMFTDNMLGKLRLISLDRCTFCARCDLKFVLRGGLPRTNGCPVPSRKLLRDTPCNQIIFIPPCHASSEIQATQYGHSLRRCCSRAAQGLRATCRVCGFDNASEGPAACTQVFFRPG